MKTREELAAEVNEWVPTLETVVLTPTEFEALDEYSTTIPTGKRIGKQWRRQLYYGTYAGFWVLGEYTEDPDPAYVGITWARINIQEKP